jgi:hypothetical protein
MGKNPYTVNYGSPLRVKDQPHRELNTLRDDYGLPPLDQFNEDISFVEEKQSEDAVNISQPIIEEVEVSCIA